MQVQYFVGNRIEYNTVTGGHEELEREKRQKRKNNDDKITQLFDGGNGRETFFCAKRR